MALGCDAAPAATDASHDGGAAVVCSQMHRDISRWQNSETFDCGPAVTDLLELTPVGNHQLLFRKRFSTEDDLWSVSPDGKTFGTEPLAVDQAEGYITAGFTLLPGPAPTVLIYDPRLPSWILRTYPPQAITHPIGARGTWPTGYWRNQATPWGHQMIGLEDGYVLDRDLGDGSSQVWRFVSGPDGTTQLLPPGDLVAGPQEAFRRGHRLVPLGGRRLLEWLPRSCGADGVPAAMDGTCAAGADYRVWRYSLDAGAGLDPQIVSSGFWPDVGAESVLASDSELLFLWTRKIAVTIPGTGDGGATGPSGRLRSYPTDPAAIGDAAAPGAAAAPLGELSSDKLHSEDWIPPTAAPNIKHLVIVLQNGRSFDSYFGRHCHGLPVADGQPPACVDLGPSCCEGIPPTTPEASTCVDPEVDVAYRPGSAADCLRAKMNGGAMDQFAVAHTAVAAAPCGDARDVACAGTGGAVGAAIYQALAGGGALADRFFQTYAFADGMSGLPLPDATTQNLLYLVTARFTSDLGQLSDSPLLTENLARQQVSWAIYAGNTNLARAAAFSVPIFYDPDWSPYRALDRGELEHDIAVGELPAVAVVVPDDDDAARSEAPGKPFDGGIAFVQGLADAIASSRYQRDTLVLVTYLTAGGFYDHVRPPDPPPAGVDGWLLDAATVAVHYGPRVPLLALGAFARRNAVSHVALEMSSLTTFIEWNWLQGTPLKTTASQTGDVRRFRDVAVANLGSLIDPGAAGVVVPADSP